MGFTSLQIRTVRPESEHATSHNSKSRAGSSRLVQGRTNVVSIPGSGCFFHSALLTSQPCPQAVFLGEKMVAPSSHHKTQQHKGTVSSLSLFFRLRKSSLEALPCRRLLPCYLE